LIVLAILRRLATIIRLFPPYRTEVRRKILTYNPGFPVQVEKLKKYSAIPIGAGS
jgi:hypothetical protein